MKLISNRAFDRRSIPLFCYRCQKPGHFRKSCPSRGPQCGICSQAHETSNCQMHDNRRGREVLYKCPNCGGGHPAWSPECTFEETVRMREECRRWRQDGPQWATHPRTNVSSPTHSRIHASLSDDEFVLVRKQATAKSGSAQSHVEASQSSASGEAGRKTNRGRPRKHAPASQDTVSEDQRAEMARPRATRSSGSSEMTESNQVAQSSATTESERLPIRSRGRPRKV